MRLLGVTNSPTEIEAVSSLTLAETPITIGVIILLRATDVQVFLKVLIYTMPPSE